MIQYPPWESRRLAVVCQYHARTIAASRALCAEAQERLATARLSIADSHVLFSRIAQLARDRRTRQAGDLA